MVKYYGAIYTISREQLSKAAILRLETTNNYFSDIFIVTAQANGNKINNNKEFGRKAIKKLPKASFKIMAGFVGAM